MKILQPKQKYFMQSPRKCLLALLSFVLVLSTFTCHRTHLPEYHHAQLTIDKTIDLNYLLYLPEGYDADIAWPLALFLTDVDSSSDIEAIVQQGIGTAFDAGLELNFLLLAPQMSDAGLWDAEALMALVSEVQTQYHIDSSKLYVTGSGDRGGWGAWDIATSYPNVFSKIAPISAPACTEICRLGDASVHIYHGSQDTQVPLADAENMRFELDHYCKTEVELIVFDSLGQDIGKKVYGSSDFWDWFTGSQFRPDLRPVKSLKKHFTTRLSRTVEDNYLLYLPDSYESGKQDWPFLIFLHGSGSAIEDIEQIRTTGPPRLFEEGMSHDFVLLAPQLHDNVPWDIERIHALILKIMNEYHIDDHRIYLTGLSRGGFGTWELAVNYPELFAAIAPISARDVPGVEKLVDSNIWIFHGGADDGVPWQGSQTMYHRLVKVGANVQFSLYEGVAHNAWDRAYGDPELWTWMVSQKLNKP